MTNSKPMTLLLIEDDEIECNLFKNHVNKRDDAKFIGITNSSTKAIELVKTYVPEGIILDLELHAGEGSGLSFLEELKSINKNFRPLIVITTNTSSDLLYSHLHNNGADFIFYKNQSGYSPEMVVNNLLLLRNSLYKVNNKANKAEKFTNIETPEERKTKICNKIDTELDLIGIAKHLKGRDYLFDSIYYLIENETKSTETSVFQYIANKYRIVNSSVGRAMQTAINRAWSKSPIEDLEIHYTAKINYETGVPTPTEFIYYYADKIKKNI